MIYNTAIEIVIVNLYQKAIYKKVVIEQYKHCHGVFGLDKNND